MDRPLTVPLDTSLEAARVQFHVLRQAGESRRLEMAASMSDFVRQVSEAGVRSRHPEYDDDQVRLAVARLLLGPRLFREAFPGCEIRP